MCKLHCKNSGDYTVLHTGWMLWREFPQVLETAKNNLWQHKLSLPNTFPTFTQFESEKTLLNVWLDYKLPASKDIKFGKLRYFQVLHLFWNNNLVRFTKNLYILHFKHSKPYPVSLRLTIKCYSFMKVTLVEICECSIHVPASKTSFLLHNHCHPQFKPRSLLHRHMHPFFLYLPREHINIKT